MMGQCHVYKHGGFGFRSHPLFMPMLMLLGLATDVIQVAYCIGGSVTNIMLPMTSYFAFILAIAVQYKKDLGLGTLIATMLLSS